MSLATSIAPQLPLLRRYARALTGSQRSGDAFVAATLQALIDSKSVLDANLSARVALYKAFNAIWSTAYIDTNGPAASILEEKARERLLALTPVNRQALLLTTIEAFTLGDAAAIMGLAADQVEALVETARKEIEQQTRAKILVIEDETLIAMDLVDIVTRLGHQVVATADTAQKAVDAAKAHQPDLVLADIQLADGSSGIDAVNAILNVASVPVIFITAFPDRLLTGERPEPTFLITKPYKEETIEAAVSQALFFQTTEVA